jgi:hypothetical protein
MSAYYGPVYTTPKISWGCVGGAAAGATSAVYTVAQRILDSPAKYGPAVQVARNLLAGEIGLDEFVTAVGAILAAPELIALLIGTGLVIGGFLLLAYCLKGGT